MRFHMALDINPITLSSGQEDDADARLPHCKSQPPRRAQGYHNAFHPLLSLSPPETA